MILARTLGALALCGTLAAAWPAAAQQTLSEEQARGFIDAMVRQMNEAVDAGAYDDVAAWLETRTVDGAEFWYDVTTVADGRRVASSIGTLGKDQALAMTGLLGGLGAQGAIGDYRLVMDVQAVQLVRNGAAAFVDATVHESGTFAAPPAAAGTPPQETGDTAAVPQAVRFAADGTCRTLLVPGDDGQPLLAAMTCHAEVTF